MNVPMYLALPGYLGRQAPGVGRQATQGSADCQHWAALKAGGARPFCASFLPVSPIKLMSTSTPAGQGSLGRSNDRPVLPISSSLPKTHGEWWPDGSDD